MSASGLATGLAGASTIPGTPDSEQLYTTSSITTTVRNRKGEVQSQKLTGLNGTLAGADSSATDYTFVNAKGVTSSIDENGGIHLRPLPASAQKGRKMRAIVNFQPRHSHFDRFNMDSGKDAFRGFYTLFWIGMGLLILNTFYTSYRETGKALSMTFAILFSRDAKVLAMTDGVLVGSLFLCVPFSQISQRGWLSYSRSLIWLQHIWQAAMLGAVVKWTHVREWPWVQSGFLVLHTLAMMMKMHSYLAVNGNMADTFWRMKRTEKTLRDRVLEVAAAGPPKETGEKDRLGAAWSRACAEALGNADTLLASEWCSLEAQQGTSLIRYQTKYSFLTKERRLSLTGASADASAADAASAAGAAAPVSKKEGYNGNHSAASSRKSSRNDAPMHIRDPHPLATHPDELISRYASEIELMREELLSNGSDEHDSGSSGRVAWPHNVTYANFWDYLLVPSLVYELEYPRTESVRLLYVLEKVLATFGTFFVIYVITEHWIMPFQPGPNEPLLGTFLQLAVPMMMNYLLIFYIMFEAICNAFAELTRFADREFYTDWWNSRSMDEFSRKWNKPVHSFLLRHVYASSISSGASKSFAMFITFLLSSLLHELVMAIVSGKIRGYLFAMQMAQMPLILLSQLPFIKRNPLLGNLIFWVGLLIGFPLLNILYISY